MVSGLVPKATGWGEYHNGESQVYFFLGNYHDMDFSTPPEPGRFMSQIAELHQRGTSPNGMFGLPIPTVCGIMVSISENPPPLLAMLTPDSTLGTYSDLGKKLGKIFHPSTKRCHQIDNETNGPWLEYDTACRQLIDVVIPRLLGSLQSDGREIRPVLMHGDRWLPFPSPFVPISRASLFLRHISAVSALKTHFAHLVIAHKKK